MELGREARPLACQAALRPEEPVLICPFLQVLLPGSVCLCVSDGSLLSMLAHHLGAEQVPLGRAFLLAF